jgi:hypothetical protein
MLRMLWFHTFQKLVYDGFFTNAEEMHALTFELFAIFQHGKGMGQALISLGVRA